MKSYLGVKLLKAKPMNRLEYNNYRGWELPSDENGGDEGYFVVYKDGYESWSPKKQFEEAYTELDSISSGYAFYKHDWSRSYESHQCRVVREADELAVKFVDLINFLKTDFFRTLGREEQERMRFQSNAMYCYGKVLGERIDNF